MRGGRSKGALFIPRRARSKFVTTSLLLDGLAAGTSNSLADRDFSRDSRSGAILPERYKVRLPGISFSSVVEKVPLIYASLAPDLIRRSASSTVTLGERLKLKKSSSG